MRTCLHLYTPESEHSVFYQILNHDIVRVVGDIVDYNAELFILLDADAQRIFNNEGLNFGNYEVIASRTEPNGYWGDIRYLFLRPI